LFINRGAVVHAVRGWRAIVEKGAMVIVPSTAAETMGLGGMLATASLGGARP
jgi:hypothetical protein